MVSLSSLFVFPDEVVCVSDAAALVRRGASGVQAEAVDATLQPKRQHFLWKIIEQIKHTFTTGEPSHTTTKADPVICSSPASSRFWLWSR